MTRIRAGDAQLARWLFFASLLIYVPLFKPQLVSDGALYHEYVRSLTMDGDLNFDNERESHTWHFLPIFSDYGVGDGFLDTGYPRQLFNIGPALAWYPFFQLGHGIAVILQIWRPDIIPDGYSFPEIMLTSVTSLPFALAGILLTMRLLATFWRRGPDDETSPVQRPEARLAIGTLVVLASPLPAFVLVAPTFSHAFAYAASAAFLAMATESFGRARSRETDLVMGFALGIATLARTQLVFLATMLLLEPIQVLRTEERRSLKTLVLSYIRIASAAFVAFSPQLASNMVIYGKLFTDPQGTGGMRWLAPQLWLVLTQPVHGLFAVTPLMAVAVAGLPLLVKRNRWVGGSLLLTFVVQTYLNAARRDWAGVGFGSRRFIESLPILTLGFVEIVALLGGLRHGRRLARGFVALATVAIPWNFLTMAQYYLTDLGKPNLVATFRSIATRNVTGAGSLLARFFARGLIGERLSSFDRRGFADIVLFALVLALIYGIVHTLDRLWPFLVELVPILVIGLTATILTTDVFLVYSGLATRHVRAYLLDTTLRQQTPDLITRYRHLALRRDAPYEGLRGGFLLDAKGSAIVAYEPRYTGGMLDVGQPVPVSHAAKEPVLKVKIGESKVGGFDVVFACSGGPLPAPLMEIALVDGAERAIVAISPAGDTFDVVGTGFRTAWVQPAERVAEGYEKRVSMRIEMDPPRDVRTIEVHPNVDAPGIMIHGLAVDRSATVR